MFSQFITSDKLRSSETKSQLWIIWKHYTLLHVSRTTPSGLFRFKIKLWKYEFSRSPLKGDRPIARPVRTQDSTKQKNVYIHLCLEQDLIPRSQCSKRQRPHVSYIAQPLGSAPENSTCHKWVLALLRPSLSKAEVHSANQQYRYYST
jgi:hypothetical protein